MQAAKVGRGKQNTSEHIFWGVCWSLIFMAFWLLANKLNFTTHGAMASNGFMTSNRPPQIRQVITCVFWMSPLVPKPKHADGTRNTLQDLSSAQKEMEMLGPFCDVKHGDLGSDSFRVSGVLRQGFANVLFFNCFRCFSGFLQHQFRVQFFNCSGVICFDFHQPFVVSKVWPGGAGRTARCKMSSGVFGRCRRTFHCLL